jgi:proton-dependent oligopeptide transporter, POT family
LGDKNVEKQKFPRQIKYIVGNEACERFSFYGMRAILVVFMIDYLKMATPDAKATYHLFNQGVYFLPLLGAFLADRFLESTRLLFGSPWFTALDTSPWRFGKTILASILAWR